MFWRYGWEAHDTLHFSFLTHSYFSFVWSFGSGLFAITASTYLVVYCNT
jgi:hypothetical protein